MKQNIGRLTTARQNNVGQLELVKQEKFAGNEVDLYKGVDGEVYMTAKQLGEALEYKEPVIAINKIIGRNEYLQNDEFSVVTTLQATDNKDYKTRLLNERGISAVVSISRRPLEVKNKVLELLGKNSEVHSHFKSRDEDEYIHLIQTAFKLFHSEREVRVGEYRCDLLFPKHKLIVECDEYGHRGYNKELEARREVYLKGRGYNVIRFNPDGDDFYIGDTLGSILEFLMSADKLKTKNNKEEQLCN